MHASEQSVQARRDVFYTSTENAKPITDNNTRYAVEDSSEDDFVARSLFPRRFLLYSTKIYRHVLLNYRGFFQSEGGIRFHSRNIAAM